MSYPQTLLTGASKYRKHLSWIFETNSAPNPQEIGASCVTKHLPVFLTESTTVYSSHGIIVRKSMISHDIPSFSAKEAAILTCLNYAP